MIPFSLTYANLPDKFHPPGENTKWNAKIQLKTLNNYETINASDIFNGFTGNILLLVDMTKELKLQLRVQDEFILEE